MTLKGSVIAVIGDNLGSHQIGGFNENFNLSGYFCRFCYINRPTNAYDFYKHWNIRNKITHTHDIDISATLGESNRGVKGNSFLNSLKHYHVCDPGLPMIYLKV